LITGKLYDWLKYLAQIVLPALGTLYFSLAQIWGFGSGTEVVGTIMAFDLFLGVLLGISQLNYSKSDKRFDGAIVVNEADDKKVISLEYNGDPNEIEQHDEVLFKVNKGKAS